MPSDFLEQVLSISRRMAAMRSLAPLLVCVVEEAIQLMGAQRGYVVLPRPDGSLDFRVTRDWEGHEVENAQDQISTSVLSRVIQTGQPLIVRDAMSDPNFGHAQSVVALKLRSIMSVPLISHGETIGAIYVENRAVRGRFQEDNLAPLILFANQAAVAIENAAINDDLEARVAARTRELEESWADVVEANRQRTLLLSYIAHDLRNPLSIARTSLELIQDGTFGPLTADQQEWIAKATRAVGATVQLTNDVLDLTKIETGKLALSLEPVALNDFLPRVYQIALGLRWPAMVTFRTDIEPTLPTLSADPGRLQQVLMNLLTNAIKFTEQGSVTLHARYLPEPGEVEIGVADTGEGIPPDQISKLFQRFQQVDRNVTRRRKGSGLGLAICRELVEKHGGRIWVESTLGVGSNFVFALPVSTPLPPAADGILPDQADR